MNIVLRELKAHRKSLMLWSAGMFLLILTGMTKFAGFANSGESANDLFKGLPALAAAFGVQSVDLTTAIGFYSILFLYVMVMTSIHASSLGVGIIAKEELGKTVEFLFAKPVTRSHVITSKLFAALINIIVLNMVALASSIVIVGSYNKGESVSSLISLLMAGLLFVQLMFLSIGMAAAAATGRPKSAAPLAAGVLMATFFLSLWLDITDNYPSLKYLTPFKYFEGKVIINTDKLDPLYVALSIAVIAVMMAVTYVRYGGRDLNI